jgi:DNA-binding MarR family transcriptional regulator
MPRDRDDEPWPPRTRDAADIAVVASRLLATSGRLSNRVRSIAKKHHIDPHLMRLLLLFAESNRPLRIGNVADSLGVSHATASRTATRAHAAGLIDKFPTSIDGREVTIRVTAQGKAAVSRCLDVLRSAASEVLGFGDFATVHPRGSDVFEMLGPPPFLHRTSDNFGWRAGVRAGMPDE